ncbi:MAG TPA: exosortase H-associated membrane protein [Rudaea sp.]
MRGLGWDDSSRACSPFQRTLESSSSLFVRPGQQQLDSSVRRNDQQKAGRDMTVSPLRRFMLAAVLWLPFAFFLWFMFAGPLVWPVVHVSKLVLMKCWPQIFTAVTQGADLLDAQGHVLSHPAYLVQLSTGVMVNVAPAGLPAKFGFIEPTVNPMAYGYALPLFAGLVLATPLTRMQRVVQFAIGFPILWLFQAFGVVSESLKTVAIDAGAPGAQAASQAGLSLNLIALCYQFGYLILPALVPAVLWIVLNRSFIENLTRPIAAEPAADGRVETESVRGE